MVQCTCYMVHLSCFRRNHELSVLTEKKGKVRKWINVSSLKYRMQNRRRVCDRMKRQTASLTIRVQHHSRWFKPLNTPLDSPLLVLLSSSELNDLRRKIDDLLRQSGDRQIVALQRVT